MKKLFKTINKLLRPWKLLPKHHQRKVVIIASAIVLILAPIVFYLMQFASKSEAVWFNDSWPYRKSIAITSHTNAETGVFINVTIDTSDNTRFQTDCGDLRFTDYSGKLLSYYIVSGCTTSSTVIHVYMQSFTAGAQSIYYYYGNLSVANGFSLSDFGLQATAYVIGGLGSEETTTAPVLYWKFDEGYGTVVNNSISKANLNPTTTVDAGTGADGTFNLALNGGAGGCNGTGLTWNAGTNTCQINPSVKATFNFSSINIPAGKTASVSAGTIILTLKNTGIATISGVINLTGMGYAFGVGLGSGQSCGSGAGGGGYGGVGSGLGCAGGTTYAGESVGSGGGDSSYAHGGNGGGAIKIQSAGAITVSGTVAASGSAALGNGAGGGSGGFISLASQVSIINNGIITTSGGAGGYGYGHWEAGACYEDIYYNWVCDPDYWVWDIIPGGAGGGGRINFITPSVSIGNTFSLGAPNIYGGGAGSNGVVLVNNNTPAPYGILSGTTKPVWQTGDNCVSGKCLYFNGSTSYVASASNINNKIKTISFWVKSATNSGYFLDLGANAYISANNGVISASGFTSPTIYVNGNQTTQFTANSWQLITITTNTALPLGFINVGLVSGNYFNGFIDELKAYQYARAASQIKSEYNSRGSYKDVSAMVGASNNTSLSNGLVGYWKMNETFSPAVDSSGNGLSGTWAGSAASGIGKFGNGISLSGSGSYTSVVDNAVLDTTSGSIAAWVKVNSLPGSGWYTIASKWVNDPYGYRILIGPSGNVWFELGDGSASDVVQSSSNVIVAGAWAYVVGTWSAGNGITLYINGALVAGPTGIKTINYSGTPGPLRIGRNVSEWDLDGVIDEVRAYNRSLSASEILALYNFTPGPVGWWRLDEGLTGNSYDSSGNDYSGLDTGTAVIQGKYGKGRGFNGANDKISVSSTILGVQTVEFWVNPASTTSNMLALTGSAYISASSGTISATGFSSPTIYVDGTVTTTLIANKWQHVTVTTGTAISASAIAFGLANSIYFNGKLDDIRFYNYVRTQKQIMGDLNAGHPSVGSPIGSAVGYWKFDEGQGINLNDSVKKAVAIGHNPSRLSNGLVDGGTGADGALDLSLGASAGGCNGTGLSWSSSTCTIITGTKTSFNFTTINIPGGTTLTSDTTSGNVTIKAIGNVTVAGTINFNGVGYVGGSGAGSAGSVTHHTAGGACFYDNLGGSGGGGYGGAGASGITQKDAGGGAGGSSYATDAMGSGSGGVNRGGGRLVIYTTGILINSGVISANGQDGASEIGGGSGGRVIIAANIINNTGTITANGGSAGSSGIRGIDCDTEVDYAAGGQGGGGRITLNSVSSLTPGIVTATGANTGVININDFSWTNDGKFGNAIILSGITGYVDIPSNPLQFQITSALTISAWVNLDTVSVVQDIASKKGSGGNYGYNLYVDSNGKINMEISGNGTALVTATGATALTPRTWYHIVGTYTPSSAITLYVNGNKDGLQTTSVPSSIYNTTANVNFGAENSGSINFLAGKIDEVKIYNYDLTADEVKREYNHGSAVVFGAISDTSNLSGGSVASNSASAYYCVPGGSDSCNSPVGEWNFEEATTGISNDSSGNGYAVDTGTSVVQGKIGKGRQFNGVSDKMSVSTTIPTVKTVEFWVKPNSATTNILALSGSAYITASSGTVAATGFTSPTIYVNGYKGGTLNANKWQHVVVVTSTAISASAITFGLANGTYFNGQLDQIRFFDYVRTPAQVAWDYNRGEPVAWWKFDDCQGNTVHDSSANNYHLTIINSNAVGSCGSGGMWNSNTAKYNYSLSFGNFDYAQSNSISPFAKSGTTITEASVSKWINGVYGGWFTSGNILSGLGISDYVGCGYSCGGSTNYWSYCIGGPLGSTILPSGWVHVVCVWKGINLKLYLNGKLIINSNTASSSVATSADTLKLFYNSGNIGGGYIDDLRLYNYALNPTQINQIMNQDSGVRFGPSSGTP